jgi:hypothetical protein
MEIWRFLTLISDGGGREEQEVFYVPLLRHFLWCERAIKL